MAKREPKTTSGPAVDAAAYPHQVPRYIHHAKHGAKLAQTADECEAHLQDGWHLQPPQLKAEPTE
jgi:hypothetical protein